jgi:hypothetical protein
MPDDEVQKLQADNEREIIDYIVQWIRGTESEIERLAAETGKSQVKTVGMNADGGADLLRVNLTCEPRQFAKREITGPFAAAIKKRL